MSKVKISNPQTLINSWFYIEGILYTVTDFRWDGGWESGEFKGYLSTSIPQRVTSPNFNVDIYFHMNTKEREITFESSLPDWGVGGVQKKYPYLLEVSIFYEIEIHLNLYYRRG